MEPWLYHSGSAPAYLGNVIVRKRVNPAPKTSQFGTTAVPFREEPACPTTKVVHNS